MQQRVKNGFVMIFVTPGIFQRIRQSLFGMQHRVLKLQVHTLSISFNRLEVVNSETTLKLKLKPT
jgi:hypothetical protein